MRELDGSGALVATNTLIGGEVLRFNLLPDRIALLPTVQIDRETWYKANMGGGNGSFQLIYGADERLIVSEGAGADGFIVGSGAYPTVNDGASMVITDFDTAEDSLELAWLGVGLVWSDASGDLVGSNTRGSTVTLEGLDPSDLPDINLLVTEYFAPEIQARPPTGTLRTAGQRQARAARGHPPPAAPRDSDPRTPKPGLIRA